MWCRVGLIGPVVGGVDAPTLVSGIFGPTHIWYGCTDHSVVGRWMLIHGPFVVFIPHGSGLSVGWFDWSSGRVSWHFFVDHMHLLGCVFMCCIFEYIHGPSSFGSHAWLHSHNWCGCTDNIQWWWWWMHTTTSPPHLPPPRKGLR